MVPDLIDVEVGLEHQTGLVCGRDEYVETEYVEGTACQAVASTHVLGPDGDFPAVLPGTGDPHAEAVHCEGHEAGLSAGQRVSLAGDNFSSASPRKGREKVAFLCTG